jgi:hypothetical protein
MQVKHQTLSSLGMASLPTRLRRLADRLGYANVVATLALFVSLGGVSYATIALPEHSVGAAQLRAGAVGLGALSFPLGAAAATDDHVEDLYRTICNGGLDIVGSPPPGPPACPSPSGPTPRRTVHLFFPSSGRLLASAVVGLTNDGAATGDRRTSAHVVLELMVDRRRAAASQVLVTGGQIAQVPIQAVADVAAGRHTAGLAVRAQYDSAGQGDVLVSGASIIASAVPA